MGWRPIETAPMDGTVVDLWMVDETGLGWREANAYYVTEREDIEWIVQLDGSWAKNILVRAGWWAPNRDYEGEDGWCDMPRRYNSVRKVEAFIEPTHWMHLPEPPKD